MNTGSKVKLHTHNDTYIAYIYKKCQDYLYLKGCKSTSKNRYVSNVHIVPITAIGDYEVLEIAPF